MTKLLELLEKCFCGFFFFNKNRQIQPYPDTPIITVTQAQHSPNENLTQNINNNDSKLEALANEKTTAHTVLYLNKKKS